MVFQKGVRVAKYSRQVVSCGRASHVCRVQVLSIARGSLKIMHLSGRDKRNGSVNGVSSIRGESEILVQYARVEYIPL